MQLVVDAPSNGPSPGKTQTKSVLNMKSKRKQNMVKKAFDLAKMADLKISITFFDKQHNTM